MTTRALAAREGAAKNMTNQGWKSFIADAKPREETVARADQCALFANRTIDRGDLSSFTGPAAVRNKPIHRWVFYKESFAPQLVAELIDSVGPGLGHILDPFAGVGTTLLEAGRKGLDATGVELLPYASYAAAIKIRAHEAAPDKIEATLRSVLASRKPPAQAPDIPSMSWAFERDVMTRLRKYQAALDQIEPSIERDIVRLAFLSVIEEVSQATKDGTSIRQIPTGRRRGRWGSTTSTDEVRELFKERVAAFSNDIRFAVPGPSLRVVTGDARDLPEPVTDRKYDMALFSPPYPNRYDYSAIYQLELSFGFVDANEQLRTLRKGLLRSHLESPWPSTRTVQNAALDEFVLGVLNRRRQGDQTSRVLRMVAGYFEDMSSVLENLATSVRPGCPIAVVVGTQTFSGQHLPTDLILAELAEALGMSVSEIWAIREKGIAPQQRRQWGDSKTRESVVLLEA
jgi:hypothetical protein